MTLTKILLVHLAAAMLVFGIQSNASSIIELTPSNTVILRGPIDEQMAGPLIAKVQQVAGQRLNILGTPNPVYLFIDSPGGSIAAGLDIIANLKNVENLKTVSLFAASMGSGIVQALPGERLGTENSILMFHRASGGVRGTMNEGSLESTLNFWKRIITKMELQNAKRMNMTLQSYKDAILNELWIHGEDNVTQKSLDRITSFKCSKELLSKTEVIVVDTFLGPMTVHFSACPLLTYPVKIGDGSEQALEKFNKVKDVVSKQFSFGHRM